MKKSELRQLIREEISRVLTELSSKTYLSEENSLLRGASKKTLARDTEESDREYTQLSKKRDVLAQKKYRKDYKELHPNQKDIINRELRS